MSSFTKPISQTIIDGMDTNNIIVGYISKGFFSHLFHRLKNHIYKSRGSTFGYYSLDDNKLVILLDDTINILGMKLRELPPIVNHEIIHMATMNNISQYKSLFLDEISKYMMVYFKNLNVPNIDKLEVSNVKKCMGDIIDKMEGTSGLIKDTISPYKTLFRTIIDDDSTIDTYTRMMIAPYYYIVIKNSSTQLINDKESLNSVMMMAKTYDDLGYKNVLSYTTPCQELLYPSEILCIMYQFKLSSKAIRLINNLNFKQQKDIMRYA
jgi:hypothetical protein